MDDVTIRKGGQGDVEAVCQLLVETWQTTYKDIYSPEQIADINARWHGTETLQNQLNDPDQYFLVAESKGKIIGHLLARYRPDKTIFLRRLYVSPDAQKSGIGKQLYQQVVAAFPQAKSVKLEVEAQNTQALRFYQGQGFVNVGRTSQCGGDSNIPALIMERLFNP